MAPAAFTWIGILILIIQSGTFSGLNLAMFGISSLRLKTLAKTGNKEAAALMEMRKDSNFLLTTILWGNVGTNVLLAMLSDSVMFGAFAFLFSTVVITFCGEIIPQAYFSRHALRVASLLSPVLRFYQVLLYPVAKPSAVFLDKWLGQEGIDYISERELIEGIRLHINSPDSEMSSVEGLGAINFLKLDDLLVTQEGEPVDPDSVIQLPVSQGRPTFPDYTAASDDPFLRQVQASGKRWIIIAGEEGAPLYALDASAFLRAALFSSGKTDPMDHCCAPIVVFNRQTSLADVLGMLKAAHPDDRLEHDLILFWGEDKRIITGADLLGYLMRGITKTAG
ncbi:hypothetical protein PDESU_05232 [Pontiella desulfatans]|uniref:CNNM transmembrane domain-containing protein n=1 Tax=Pontiella desulfatans TaxID=2750659 RepID=A0A6C2UAV3_PONDE|nr:DUF21 domain-containing protein [Pontiella desulfatans]VGO16641.1 hypothetical protein PDESU_05232 [Pontiella desulfatans]